MNSHRFTITLQPELARQLRAAAAGGGSISAFVAAAVAQKIENTAAPTNTDGIEKILTLAAAIYTKSDQLAALITELDQKNVARFKAIAAGVEQISRGVTNANRT